MSTRRILCKRLTGFLVCLLLAGSGMLEGQARGAGDDSDSDSDNNTVLGITDERPSPAAKSPKPAVAGIRVSFKLDPLLTRSVHMGDRWVSPPTFTSIRQPGKQVTVEARAAGVDERGRLLDRRLAPEWVAVDPDMISISPSAGNVVTILVQRPGESTVQVTSPGLSKILTLKATYDERDGTTQVEISQ